MMVSSGLGSWVGIVNADYSLGLHIGPQGYRLVFDELVKLINEKFPEYPPYKMPYTVKVPWEKEMGAEFWDVKNDK